MNLLERLIKKKDTLIDIKIANEIYAILSNDGEIILSEIAIFSDNDLLVQDIEATLSFNNNDISIYSIKFQKVLKVDDIVLEESAINSISLNIITKKRLNHMRIYSFTDINRLTLINEFQEFQEQIFHLLSTAENIDFSRINQIITIAHARIVQQLGIQNGKYQLILRIKLKDQNSNEAIDKVFKMTFDLNDYVNNIAIPLNDMLRRTAYNIINSPGVPKDIKSPIYKADSVKKSN